MSEGALLGNSRAPRSDPVATAAGLALLSVRFVQGFIYWGGGSRRFLYAPSKLDPSAHDWMANKFQSAMPGALLGTDHVIAYLLHHFILLFAALILFSAAELLCGLGLIFSFMSRLSAAGFIVFSVLLMLMFGWQGATWIDEWTMAAANLAMGVMARAFDPVSPRAGVIVVKRRGLSYRCGLSRLHS